MNRVSVACREQSAAKLNPVSFAAEPNLAIALTIIAGALTVDECAHVDVECPATVFQKSLADPVGGFLQMLVVAGRAWREDVPADFHTL